MQSFDPDSFTAVAQEGGFDLPQIEALIAGMIQGVMVMSEEAVVAVNQAAVELFEAASREQLLGPLAGLAEKFEVFIPNGARVPPANWPGARALRGETTANLVLQVRSSDGDRVWMHNYCASPIGDAAGTVRLALVTLEEISERLDVQAALRTSEERYRSLVAATAAVVWTMSAEGLFAEPQPSWEAYTGQKWEGHRGWGWTAMVHPEDRERVALAWQEAVLAVKPYEESGRLWHRASRDYRHYEARAVPILNADGSVREWAGSCIDVHERRVSAQREREARQQAEAANRAKDEFLAVLSHELRTPLMPALLTTADLAERPDLGPELRGQLQIVLRNIDLESRLIDDLLDHTRIKSGKLALRRELVDVGEVLRDTVRDAEPDFRRKDQTVRLNLDATTSHISGDAIRLRQIFWNLLRNAIKFTPLGGRIELTVTNPALDRLAVKVRDSGMGIAAEMLPRIFSRFEQGSVEVTRSYGGLGLGLAITKSLVELHGGAIRAASDGPGRGATFTVVLPTAADPRARIRSELVALRPPTRPLRILLVEDHDDTRNIMAGLLRRHGHTVTPAACVAEALEAGRAGDFELLISDIGLPDGDGRDLLRQLPPGLEAISLSGFGMEQDVAASKAAGFAAHLTKPIEFSRLRALIQEVMSGEK